MSTFEASQTTGRNSAIQDEFAYHRTVNRKVCAARRKFAARYRRLYAAVRTVKTPSSTDAARERLVVIRSFFRHSFPKFCLELGLNQKRVRQLFCAAEVETRARFEDLVGPLIQAVSGDSLAGWPQATRDLLAARLLELVEKIEEQRDVADVTTRCTTVEDVAGQAGEGAGGCR